MKRTKKRINLSLYLTYAILCAVVYSIPMLLVLINKTYEQIWLLFLGNSLFFVCVLFSIIHVNKKLYENGNLGTLVLSGIYVTLASIGIITILTLLLYLGFDLSSIQKTGNVEAVHNVANRDDSASSSSGLVFMLFVCGLFVNLFVGGFASFIAAVTAKGKQTTEKGKKVSVRDDVSKNATTG